MLLIILGFAALLLGAVDIYLAVRLAKRLASQRSPVIIEDVTPDGTAWVVSLDGPNPEPDLCIACATREDAMRLKGILEA
jgi:hypothetical protein